MPWNKRSLGGTELTSEQTRTTVPLAQAPALPDAVAACDALSAALLQAQLADGAHANALACPVSLALNLAMGALGATDPAAQGLNTLLGAPDESSRNTTWSAVQTALQHHDRDVSDFDPTAKAPEEPLLHVADQITVVDHDSETPVEQTFIDSVRQWFSADMRRVDDGEAQEVLDQWVNDNTAELIKRSALKADGLDLALQNAVLFAARWKAMFEEKNTTDRDFTLAGGEVVQVPSMSQTSTMTCTEGSSEGTGGPVSWKVLRIPYSEDFALDVVLPQEGTLPEELPTTTWAQASALLDEAETEHIYPEVSLWLPRVDLETAHGGIDVMPVLDSLGVDIRPMGRIGENFTTTQYRQQVRMIVREDGTVAAAVSEHGGAATAPNPGPTTDFHVDRPYTMRLRDLTTGMTLFEAIINDPR